MRVRYNVRVRVMIEVAGLKEGVYLPGPQLGSDTWQKTHMNSQNIRRAESDAKLILLDLLNFLEGGIEVGILTGIDPSKVLVWAWIYCGNKLVRVWSGNNRMADILGLAHMVHCFRRPMSAEEAIGAARSLPPA